MRPGCGRPCLWSRVQRLRLSARSCGVSVPRTSHAVGPRPARRPQGARGVKPRTRLVSRSKQRRGLAPRGPHRTPHGGHTKRARPQEAQNRSAHSVLGREGMFGLPRRLSAPQGVSTAPPAGGPRDLASRRDLAPVTGLHTSHAGNLAPREGCPYPPYGIRTLISVGCDEISEYAGYTACIGGTQNISMCFAFQNSDFETGETPPLTHIRGCHPR